MITNKIILLRHGQSTWNLENKFTGWMDVDLTERGIKEAMYAADEILNNNIIVDTIYCSILNRAVQTAKIVADKIGYPLNEIAYDWHLNERHYGNLQGLNKSETAKKYGEDQILVWRRSFDIPPPLLKKNDKRCASNIKKFADLNIDLPKGESLKNVIKRMDPFLKSYMKFVNSNKNNNHLIVAHSNSLRAIMMVLEKFSKEEIVSINIPTGVPLVYELDREFNVLSKRFLIDKKELENKQNEIINQGKIR